MYLFYTSILFCNNRVGLFFRLAMFDQKLAQELNGIFWFCFYQLNEAFTYRGSKLARKIGFHWFY